MLESLICALNLNVCLANTKGANLLRWNSNDVGCEYGVLVDANKKDKVKCKLCDKVMQEGIYNKFDYNMVVCCFHLTINGY